MTSVAPPVRNVRLVAQKLPPRKQLTSKLHALADAYITPVADAVSAASRSLQLAASDAMLRGFLHGDKLAVEAAVPWDAWHAALHEHLDPVMSGLVYQSAADALDDLRANPRRRSLAKAEGDLPPDIRQQIDFALTNPNVAVAVQSMVTQLSQVLDASTMQAVRDTIAYAVENSMAPAQSARLLRSALGLNSQQAGALANYRDGLVSAGVSPARIETLVAAYGDRLLRDRAMMVARTETLHAERIGLQSGWSDAVGAGLLDTSVYGQTWITGNDDRVCDDCGDLESADPIPMGASFGEGGDGPPLHPMCRCSLGIAELPAELQGQSAASSMALDDVQPDGDTGGLDVFATDPERTAEAVVSSLESNLTARGMPLLPDLREGAVKGWTSKLQAAGMDAVDPELKSRVSSAAQRFADNPDMRALFPAVGRPNVVLATRNLDGALPEEQAQSIGGTIFVYQDPRLGKYIVGANETPGPDAVTAFSHQGWDGVLMHEYGHQVFHASSSEFLRAWEDAYSALDTHTIGGAVNISMYGDSRSSEGFSELFAAMHSPFFDPARYSPAVQHMAGIVREELDRMTR